MITIRASSLGELLDCPARWEAKYIHHRRLPSTGVSRLGTAIHASTAVYDKQALMGTPISPDDAIDAGLKEIHQPDIDVIWEEELTVQQAETIAINLHRLYCEEIAPQQIYVGVEVACQSLELSDLGIALTGTTDRIRQTISGYGIADIKTGKKAVKADGTVKTAGFGPQVAIYELLASKTFNVPMTEPPQIIGLQTGKTLKGIRGAIGEMNSPQTALIGDEERPGLLRHVSHLLQAGLFYPNSRSMLCSIKYCPIYSTCTAKD